MMAAGFCRGSEVNDRSEYLFCYPDLIHIRRPKPPSFCCSFNKTSDKTPKAKEKPKKSAIKCFFATILWQDLITLINDGIQHGGWRLRIQHDTN